MKKFERIAGSEDAMLLRDVISKMGDGNMSASLEAKIDTLIVALGKLLERPEQGSTEPAIDIPELIAKVYESTQSKSNYEFKVERNSSGLLTGITAVKV